MSCSEREGSWPVWRCTGVLRAEGGLLYRILHRIEYERQLHSLFLARISSNTVANEVQG